MQNVTKILHKQIFSKRPLSFQNKGKTAAYLNSARWAPLEKIGKRECKTRSFSALIYVTEIITLDLIFKGRKGFFCLSTSFISFLFDLK